MGCGSCLTFADKPMAGYSNRSLRDKLGLKGGMRAVILNAPATIRREIDSRSEATTRLSDSTYDFIHVFAASRSDLEGQIAEYHGRLAPEGLLWISWKKKSADPAGDLNENIIREIGLRAGLVDVKVCAVDETWSALKFVFRKADRPKL